eukprot:scaffold246357_cov22-Tisochrysis_lutea.AAC.1
MYTLCTGGLLQMRQSVDAGDNAKGQSGGFGSLEALLLQKNRHLEHELTMARLKVRVESLEALLLQKNRHLARELTMARLKARQAVSSQHTQQTQRQPASRSAVSKKLGLQHLCSSGQLYCSKSTAARQSSLLPHGRTSKLTLCLLFSACHHIAVGQWLL